MAITDELREYTEEQIKWLDMTKVHYRKLFAIADRIDAEHHAAIRRWQQEIDALRDELREAVRLSEDKASDMVELPKDADGEYIHIGDWMENGERVERIVLTDGSWEPYVYLAKTPYVLHEYFCNEISHYKQPTVEDVLRDMHAKLDEVTALYVGEAIDSDERDRDVARIFAEYAAKLRLAGDAE